MTARQATRTFFDAVERWSKAVGGLILLGGFVAGLWAQFIGPGLRDVARNFLGVIEIVQQQESLKSEIIARFEEIESIIPPPTVVEYNEDASNQVGLCSSARCVYVLTANRTDYGAQCGAVVEAQPFLRTSSGQLIQVSYRGFTPVQLGREPRSFQVPLDIPSFVETGRHQWRTRLIYESCPGRFEPIPRHSPWLPIEVTATP